MVNFKDVSCRFDFELEFSYRTEAFRNRQFTECQIFVEIFIVCSLLVKIDYFINLPEMVNDMFFCEAVDVLFVIVNDINVYLDYVQGLEVF